MPDWVYFLLSMPILLVAAFFLRALIGIVLPSVAYSRSIVAILALALSIGNYIVASRIPSWITGSHQSPLWWLGVTLLAVALSLSVPPSKTR